MNFNERIAFNQRKLDHYNKWLLDPKREFGTRYPGFPEEADSPYASTAKREATQVIQKAKVTAKQSTPKVKVKRAPRGEGPTKQERALEIYKANSKLSKDNLIELIRTELQMSLAGATTYYYNSKRAAGH